MSKIILAIVVLLILGGGGFLLLQNNTDQPTSTSPSTTAPLTGEPTLSETMENVKEFTITGSDYDFDLKQIRVQSGDVVRITFKNAQGIHDLVIPEFNIATRQLGTGKEETIEFVANKTGSFEYYCSVSNHRAMGMRGELIVE